MSLGRFRRPVVTSRARVERSEAVLVEQYGSLVRLAYLVLPASAGRHRRILTAHSVVQRALPGAGGTAPRTPRVPAPRRGPASPAPETADLRNELRTVVLRAALGRGRRGRWPHRHRASPGLLPALPIVIGLRLLPRSGSSEDMTVARLLASEQPATRGAYVLRHMDRLPEPDVLDVLRAAGAGDPEGAVRKADRLRLDVGGTVGADSVSPGPSELDACTVWAQPTDLLRRRRRIRVAGAALLAGAVTTTALVVLHDTPRSASEQPASAPAPHLLRRTAPESGRTPPASTSPHGRPAATAPATTSCSVAPWRPGGVRRARRRTPPSHPARRPIPRPAPPNSCTRARWAGGPWSSCTTACGWPGTPRRSAPVTAPPRCPWPAPTKRT
ncbi:hypothetical protein ABZ177_29425 [Streptomyces sp. NPDC006284]|uniref:hypothetical protein n=1 Tax=Streptomyces sp. NPDC006284 TaxID=3156742 RepID=UPI0033AE054E